MSNCEKCRCESDDVPDCVVGGVCPYILTKEDLKGE